MSLDELRNNIRECDRNIISEINRRQMFSKSIAELKSGQCLEIIDEVQRQKVIDNALSLAEEYSLDKEAICLIFNRLIKMSEDTQKQWIENSAQNKQ